MSSSIWARSAWAFLAVAAISSGASAGEVLRISWPEHWEVRPPVDQGSVVRLQARGQREGTTRQMLNLTAVSTTSAEKRIDAASLTDLISRLRDLSLQSSVETSIELVPMAGTQGYYFVATDRNYRAGQEGQYRQMIEGVMLKAGYLINFTLLTNDAGSDAAKLMVAAVTNARIE